MAQLVAERRRLGRLTRSESGSRPSRSLTLTRGPRLESASRPMRQNPPQGRRRYRGLRRAWVPAVCAGPSHCVGTFVPVFHCVETFVPVVHCAETFVPVAHCAEPRVHPGCKGRNPSHTHTLPRTLRGPPRPPRALAIIRAGARRRARSRTACRTRRCRSGPRGWGSSRLGRKRRWGWRWGGVRAAARAQVIMAALAATGWLLLEAAAAAYWARCHGCRRAGLFRRLDRSGRRRRRQ